jgi:hypothetical protein
MASSAAGEITSPSSKRRSSCRKFRSRLQDITFCFGSYNNHSLSFNDIGVRRIANIQKELELSHKAALANSFTPRLRTCFRSSAAAVPPKIPPEAVSETRAQTQTPGCIARNTHAPSPVTQLEVFQMIYLISSIALSRSVA